MTEMTETDPVSPEQENKLEQALANQFHPFAKVFENDEHTFILAPVLVPEEEDHQGDIISADEIELAAHDFIEDSRRPGLMHKILLGNRDACVVESYITRFVQKFDDLELPAGTWMLGMRVYDETLRKAIREGELTGFSIGGRGKILEEDRD